jgi:hypothetical protein
MHRGYPEDPRLAGLIKKVEAAVEHVLREDPGDELLYGRAG